MDVAFPGAQPPGEKVRSGVALQGTYAWFFCIVDHHAAIEPYPAEDTAACVRAIEIHRLGDLVDLNGGLWARMGSWQEAVA